MPGSCRQLEMFVLGLLVVEVTEVDIALFAEHLPLEYWYG